MSTVLSIEWIWKIFFLLTWPQVRGPVPGLRRDLGPVRGVLPLQSAHRCTLPGAAAESETEVSKPGTTVKLS